MLLLKTNIRTVIYFEYASARDRPSWAYMPRAFVPGVGNELDGGDDRTDGVEH